MTQDENNIDKVLNEYLPSASKEETEVDCDRVLQHLRSRPRQQKGSWSSWQRIALIPAAAAILLALFTSLVWQQKAFAVVERVDGHLYRVVDGAPTAIQAGDTLDAGDTVRTNGGFGTMLVLADGSRVEMRSKSELMLERTDAGVRVRLNEGDVIVTAAKQAEGRHLRVQTKDVTVSVVGTVFVVKAEESGSSVSVIEGEVLVQQGETEKSLRPGEQVISNPTMKPLPVTEEIAWSREAPLHLALLQQSVVTPTQPREAFDEVVIRRNTAAGATVGRGQTGATAGTRNDPCTGGQEPRIDPVLFDTTNTTVIQLIAWAYGMDCIPFRGLDLVSGPDWLKTEGYDVRAIRPEGPNDYTSRAEGRFGTFIIRKPGPKIQRMLQTMLAERFGLQMRRDSKEMSVYVLSVARDGPKHTAARPMPAQQPAPDRAGSQTAPGINPEFSVWKEGDNPCCQSGSVSEIDGRRKTMADLASTLSASWIMGRPVLDRTGLKGDFNFYFQFEPREPNARPSPEGPFPTTPIFKVLEQVGLELRESKEKVDTWVIDRVERATEN
jgi:uncharacterized protein (TIGR03435 family)